MKQLLATILCSITVGVLGADVTADSNSRDDVQAAILSANDGDTVIIPDGAVNWTNGVKATNIALTIRPQNRYGLSITNNHLDTSTESALFAFSNLRNKYVDISGIVFYEHDTINSEADISIGWVGSQVQTNMDWRIHHCRWPRRYGVHRAVLLSGKVYGLIDQNEFYAPTNADTSMQDITVFGDSFDYAPTQIAGTSWTLPNSMGTTNAVVIQSNIFSRASTQDSAVEGYNGARIAVRFNTITNDLLGAHGNDSGTRSTYFFEIYGNTFAFTNEANQPSGIFDTRGGTAIVASNQIFLSFAGALSTNIQVMSYRSTYNNIFSEYPSGFLGITNINDGCSNSTGWPGLDQVGRIGPTVFNATNSSQPPFIMAAWSNLVTRSDLSQHHIKISINPALTYDDTGWPAGLVNQTNHLIEGRDFTNDVIVSTSDWQPLGPHPRAVDTADLPPGRAKPKKRRLLFLP